MRLLFKRTHAEHIYFLLCQVAPVAALEVLLGQSGEEDAVQLEHFVTEVLEDAADNAVATTVNLYAYLLLVCFGSIFYGIGVDLAIVECDALCNLVKVSGRSSA